MMEMSWFRAGSCIIAADLSNQRDQFLISSIARNYHTPNKLTAPCISQKDRGRRKLIQYYAWRKRRNMNHDLQRHLNRRIIIIQIERYFRRMGGIMREMLYVKEQRYFYS